MEREGFNRKIVLLGDDDLLSIALGFSGQADEIYVLELDTKLADYIRDMSEKHNLNIRVDIVNLANSLPSYLSNEYDIFIADPYPMSSGLMERVFLSRGMTLVKPGVGIGYVFCAPTHKHPRFLNIIMKEMKQLGLKVTDFYPNLSWYATIPGEFTRLEEDYRQENNLLYPISHWKSMARVCVPSSDEVPHQSQSFETEFRQWTSGIKNHDLLTQADRGTGRIQLNNHSTNYDGHQYPEPTYRIARVIESISGLKMTDQEIIKKYEDDHDLLLSKARKNGYSLQPNDLRWLFDLATEGVAGVQHEGEFSRPDRAELYILARILESRYRHEERHV